MPLLGAGRTRLLGLFLLLATFVAGALAGAAVDRVLTAGEAERAEQRAEREDNSNGRSYIIDEVEMRPAQRAAIDSILERRADRLRAIWRSAEPRMEAITDSARLEIMQVLTPEQRAEYETRLQARQRAVEARRRSDGGQRN